MAYTLVYTSIDALTTSVTGYTGTPVDVVVPETADGGRTVVGIGDSAFALCTSIISISMPSVVTIKASAFLSCTALELVRDTPLLAVIESAAFRGCTSLTSIIFNGNAPTFGILCFEDGNYGGVPIPATAYILPTATGWPTPPTGVGDPPIPTAYSEPATATVSCTTTADFVSTSLSGTWTPLAGSTGAPVYSEYTIGEAWDSAESLVFFSLQSFIGSATDVTVGGWDMAELTVYESLAAYIGNTADVDCFRGYLPINEDGDLRASNIWMITSGGTAGAFDVERTYGTSGLWCNVLTNAELTGVFENRTTAMNFCGAVMAWLKETSNLNQTGNINWCHLRNLPEAPKERIIKNHRYWEVNIPLEILFLTEAMYA